MAAKQINLKHDPYRDVSDPTNEEPFITVTTFNYLLW